MIEIIKADDKNIYNEFILNHEYGDVLQLSNWGDVKDDLWTPKQYFFKNDEDTIGACQILYRKLPLGYKIAYIPRGPVIDYSNKDEVKKIFSLIEKLAKSEKCVRVTFDPRIERNGSEDILKLFDELQYTHTGFFTDMREIQPRYNMIFDISGCMDEIIKSFSKGMKAKFKKIDDLPISVESITEEKWEDFYLVMKESAIRNGITIRSLDYFKKIYRCMGEFSNIFIAYLDVEKAIEHSKKTIELINKEISNIKKSKELTTDENDLNNKNEIIASKENAIKNKEENIKIFMQSIEKGKVKIPISTSVEIYCNKYAYYLYAGSTNDYREYMPVPCLIKNNIEAAKAKGAIKYDLGGVSGSTDCDDKYYGLYEFKKSFVKNPVEYIGEFEIPISKIINSILNSAIKLRQSLIKYKNKKRAGNR